MTHSEFSPSKAHRWLNCSKSVELEKDLPSIVSSYATEGTLAHKVCENMIVNKGKCTLENIPTDMLDYCRGYYDYFIELKPLKYWVETKVNLDSVIPNTYGFCDLIVVDKENNTHIIDFKYGAGVGVSAMDNEQLLMYALGIIDKMKLKDKSKFFIHIYQPRIFNISCFETNVEYIKSKLHLYKNAYLLAKGSNPFFVVGEKQCKFCKANNQCPALLNKTKEVKDIMSKDIMSKDIMSKDIMSKDIMSKDIMSKEDIILVLDNAKLITNFINNVESLALKNILDGEEYEGYKVVEGRSVRSYTHKAEEVIINAVGEDKAYNKKLIGITEVSKLLSKDVVNSITFKPQGKPTLVKNSDKRQALDYGNEFEKLA